MYPLERAREHYEIEKELANKLRHATRDQRRTLYTEVYNELFQRVAFHPQTAQKSTLEGVANYVENQLKLLRRFLRPDATYLELGAGDCVVALEVAQYVRQVYAVDVSDTITEGVRPPANFQLALSDGCSIPVPAGSVDIAYSNQLMEHLHPEDAEEQLRNIHRALAVGGQYLCITPNRLSGPHDISWLFDREATGFHLREYTVRDLRELFFRVGFSAVKVYVGGRGFYSQIPARPILAVERILSCLPFSFRRAVTNGRLASALLGIRIVGVK